MRGLLMIWSDPSWDEPIISLVADVVISESWGEQELPTGSRLEHRRIAEVTHADGHKERVRIWSGQTLEVILDDGRPFGGRDAEEASAR